MKIIPERHGQTDGRRTRIAAVEPALNKTSEQNELLLAITQPAVVWITFHGDWLEEMPILTIATWNSLPDGLWDAALSLLI